MLRGRPSPTPRRLLGVALLASLVLVAWWRGGTTDRATPAITPAPATMQADFIQTVRSFVAPYRDAPNELQASDQRRARRDALAHLLPDRAVRDWVGTLRELETVEGNAYITIELADTPSIHISNASMERSAPIAPDTALYRTLAQMQVGDRITFSGTFLIGEDDYLMESSLFERLAMTEPTFVMEFSDVQKR